MNRKIKTAIAMFLASIMCFGAGGAIYARAEVSVINSIETAVVNIELEEYQNYNGTEEPFENQYNILPGRNISKIPRIYNKGVDCWIRVKLDITEDADWVEPRLYGISDKWIKAEDGYYYYKQVLKEGENVDFFKGFTVPDDLDQDYWQEKAFEIEVNAEAIQCRNFTPDFISRNPWGFVEIETYTGREDYNLEEMTQTTGSDNFEIKYLGGVDQLVKNREDFFKNFTTLVPGDRYSDTMTLNNPSSSDINLYFRSEAKSSKLLDQMYMKITCTIDGSTKTIYEGNMGSSEIKNDILLGTLKSGQTGTWNYEIYMPNELQNEYTLLSDKITWIYSCDKIVNESPNQSEKTDTGDTSMVIPFFILGSCCLGVAFILVAKSKKKEQNS